tara:strand:+ start:138 stop:863 length:726 start_codon:yes stop_codon:yes gene_type:complete
MRRSVKKKDYEKLSDTNIQETLELLESGTPFTKKEACLKLNISYNTSRLKNILADYQDKIDFREKRKSQNRGKPAAPYEITETIVLYLNQEPISSIASSLFRSPSFIKGILNKVGVPEIPTKENRSRVYHHKFAFLPDVMIGTIFEPNEWAWSAKHHGLVKVKNEIDMEYQNKPGYLTIRDYEKIHGSKLYDIIVAHKGDFSKTYFPNVKMGGTYDISLAYDLGKLDHFKDYGVDVERLLA